MARSRAVWLVGLAFVVGCGDPGPPLVPVAGVVWVNGKPLTTGSVSFRPDADKGNTSLHHPTGSVGADGRFELFTVGRPGAPPGHYKVLVFADANTDPNTRTAAHPKPPAWLTDVKYTSERTTDLRVEVVPTAEPGRYDLKLVK
jgi:hypothetical protein